VILTISRAQLLIVNTLTCFYS